MLLIKTQRRQMAAVGAVAIFLVIMQTPMMLGWYIGHRSKSAPGGEKESKEQLVRWIEWGHLLRRSCCCRRPVARWLKIVR